MDTPIPTPSGWSRFSDLKVGDWVFGPDGMPCRIIAQTPVFEDPDCYEIEFDDGARVKVSSQHRWTVERKTRKRLPGAYKSAGPQRLYRETVTLSTREIADHAHAQDNRLAVPINAPLETPEAVLHIGPYTLGCWLGDGTSADGTITFGDAEIAEGITSEGYRMGELIGVRTMRRTIYGLGPLLRSLNLLRNKHIPVFYQRASTAQRLALLRGLMDTDGHCNTRGTATFVNKNEQLVDNVMELCTGLGLKPSKYRFEASHGTYWHVAFQAYQDHNPFLITRKASRAKTGARPHPRRYITAVRPIPTEAMCCIQVDRPDGLYLTGRSMVTIHDGTSTTLYR